MGGMDSYCLSCRKKQKQLEWTSWEFRDLLACMYAEVKRTGESKGMSHCGLSKGHHLSEWLSGWLCASLMYLWCHPERPMPGHSSCQEGAQCTEKVLVSKAELTEQSRLERESYAKKRKQKSRSGRESREWREAERKYKVRTFAQSRE